MKIPNNSMQSFLHFFRNSLKDVLSSRELEATLYEVFYSLFGLSRIEISMQEKKNFSESEILSLFRVVKELQKGRPLAYVLRQKHFFGMDLYVDENVLIPRAETEELLAWMLENPVLKQNDIDIVDIGTGSGCIALALKMNLPKANVTAVDLSESALSVARKNAEKLSLEIDFKQMDILQDSLEKDFHVLVSNPPYISAAEKPEMERNVLDHEPHIALFAEDDPLVFYKRMAEIAIEELPSYTWIYWEINQYLWEGLIEFLEDKKFRSIEIKKDINNNFRMIRFQNILKS